MAQKSACVSSSWVDFVFLGRTVWSVCGFVKKECGPTGVIRVPGFFLQRLSGKNIFFFK